jgi:hypothetical protein
MISMELSGIALDQDRTQDARAHADRAVKAFRSGARFPGLVMATRRQIEAAMADWDHGISQGDFAVLKREMPQAEQELLRLLEVSQDRGDPWAETAIRELLGRVAMRRADSEVARREFREVLRLSRQHGIPHDERALLRAIELFSED